MAEPYDFYREFLAVDIAKVEQVASLVARVEAIAMTTLLAEGISEELALKMIGAIHKSVVEAVLNRSWGSSGG